MGLAQGVYAGTSLADGMIDEYKKSKLKSGLGDIYGATPDDGTKPAEQSTWSAIKNGVSGVFGGQADAPQVEADPNAPKQYKLLGVTQDQPFTDDQARRIRSEKAADYMADNGDPVSAEQLRQEAGQTDIQQRKIGAIDKEEQLQKDREALAPQLNYFAKGKQYLDSQKEYQTATVEYQAKLQAGATPQQLGLPPQPPKPMELTPAETLQDTAMMLSLDAKHGNYDPKQWAALTDMIQKVKDEGYETALKLAQSGAPIERVIEEFNKSGDTKLKAENVVSYQQGKTQDGMPTAEIVIRGDDGKQKTINTFAELSALDKVNDIVKSVYAGKKDQREELTAQAKAEQAQAAAQASLSSIDRNAASAEYSRAGAEQRNVETDVIKRTGFKVGTKGRDSTSSPVSIETNPPDPMGNTTRVIKNKQTGESTVESYNSKGELTNTVKIPPIEGSATNAQGRIGSKGVVGGRKATFKDGSNGIGWYADD